MGKDVLISFTFEGQEQYFKVNKNDYNVGEELVKFICYLEDHFMSDYFKSLLKNKNFNFNEAFCITNLKQKTNVEEVPSKEGVYFCEYIVDFDCDYLCRIKNSSIGFRNYEAYPFEQLAEYPYLNTFQE
jgi:hypothetical protein